MAPRRRLRIRRFLIVLGILAFLLAMFDLNRFLPGSWPMGGAESGFRRRSVSGPDADRLRPPESERPPMPTDGIVVVLKGAGGDEEVAVDAPGAERRRPSPDGSVTLEDERLVGSGLVVRRGGDEVRHGPIDPEVARTWTLHLPDDLPTAPPAGDGIEVQVVTASDGRPVGGVQVRVVGAVDIEPVVTDREGRARFEDIPGRALLEVSAPGFGVEQRWAHVREGRTIVLRLRQTPRLPQQYVDASTGASVEVSRLRVLAPDGRLLWETRPSLGGLPSAVDAGGDFDGAVLEIWSTSHPVARIPLGQAGRTVSLPAGRTFEIDIRDPNARKLTDVRLTAAYVPVRLGGAPSPGTEPATVLVPVAGALDEKGREQSRVTVTLPADQEARLLLEAGSSAPRTIEIGREDAPDVRRERLSPARACRVRVTDADGEPIGGARIVARSLAGGSRIQRSATTLPNGTAMLQELAQGTAEVYAHLRGYAWSMTLVEVPEGSGRMREPVVLTLQPGRTLRLVVESAMGLPLEGVRVREIPADDAEPPVVPPDARPWRTDADGVLVLRDLRDRPRTLAFSRPGYRDVRIEGLAPGAGVHFVTLLAAE